MRLQPNIQLAPSTFTPSGWPRYTVGQKKNHGTRTLTKVFGLKTLPSPRKLHRLAHCLAPGQSAELDVGGVVCHLDPREGLSMTADLPQGTRPSTVMIKAEGDDPTALIDTLRRTLGLETTLTHEIEQSEVWGFVHDVWHDQQRKKFTLAEVYARLDFWGARALPHLQGISREMYPGRWAIARRMARRVLEQPMNHRLYPEGTKRPPVMRWARKPIKRGASIGMSGWPLKGILPRDASLVAISQDEHVRQWVKEDVMMRSARHLLGGTVSYMHKPKAQGEGEYEIDLTPQLARTKKAYRYVPDVRLGDEVNLRSIPNRCVKGRMREEDMRLMDNIALELLGIRVFGAFPVETKPIWWRLGINPFVNDGMNVWVSSLTSPTEHDGVAIRLFSPQYWMRIYEGSVVFLAYGNERSRAKHITGVVIEGHDKQLVRKAATGLHGILGVSGKRVKGSRG